MKTRCHYCHKPHYTVILGTPMCADCIAKIISCDGLEVCPGCGDSLLGMKEVRAHIEKGCWDDSGQDDRLS